MRALLKPIFFVLLMASIAACASTSHNDSNSSNSSSDPQVRYGGQMTVRGQATKGTNQ